MPTYFRGWRRKIGVATLVIALVSAAAWMRGVNYGDDQIERQAGDRTTYIAGLPPAGFWFAKKVLVRAGIIWDSEYAWIVVVPYSYVAIPLTVTSAYLLISNPRPKPPKAL